MQRLVQNLEQKLISKGLKLDITGKELMAFYGVTEDYLVRYCNDNYTSLDGFFIEASTKYAEELKQLIDFDDEVYWYIKNEQDPKYVTIGMDTMYDECDSFCGYIYKKGNLKYFSANLIDFITILKNVSKEDEIKLSLSCCYDLNLNLYFKNKELVKVDTTEIEKYATEDECAKELLYQLMVLSYDVPLVNTLEVLKIIK